MRAPIVLLVGAAALLPGCVSGLLEPPAASARDAACALLRPGDFPTAILRVEVVAGSPPFPPGALENAAATLRAAMQRSGTGLRTQITAAPDHVWDERAITRWSQNTPEGPPGSTVVRILWLGGGDKDATGSNPGPGAVVLQADATMAGASRLGRDPQEVVGAVLLHHLGHALGVVNRGIPVQDPRIQEREGPAGHEPDPASVLHVGWERASTMVWMPGSAYDNYSPSIVADWGAARAGVCA